MKQISKFLTRLRRTLGPRQGKAGSSLGLVMIIGAALVIWVMCIMPLMTTTGTAALKTQSSYDAYLTSRSSIEFAKSELENIVEDSMPYTFAVIKNGDLYIAIPKMISNGISLNPDYSSRINVDLTNKDTLDKPQQTNVGNEVTAICAAEFDSVSGKYELTITTFNNGDAGLIYNAYFTPSGSLLIFPEAYMQSQALPLSDFVVVDGKLGSNVIWSSDITMSVAKDRNFTEIMLPWKDPTDENYDPSYANSGEYPAVFKTTAIAAVSGNSDDEDTTIGTPETDGIFTTEVWIEPKAVSKDVVKKPGNLWIENNEGVISVFLYQDANNRKIDVTDYCTLYLNYSPITRFEDSKVPDYGIYSVFADFEVPSDDNSISINLLSVEGLRFPDTVGSVNSRKQELPDCTVSVTESGGNYSVTFNHSDTYDDILYGYCTASATADETTGMINLTWGNSKTLTLPSTEDYYFYIFRASDMVDGVFYSDSKVKYVGMAASIRPASEVISGESYIIAGQTNGKYYGMTSSLGVQEINTLYDVSASYPTWTMTQEDSGWSFKNGSKYLKLTGRYSLSGWGYKLDTNSSISDDCKFNIAFSGNSASVSKTLTYKGIFNTYTTTGYVKISKSGCEGRGSGGNIYFLKFPTSAPTNVAAPVSQTYTLKNNTINYLVKSRNYVEQNVTPSVEIVDLYANGVLANSGLQCGIYDLVAYIKEGDNMRYVAIENPLIITKVPISDAADYVSPAPTFSYDNTDELTVHVENTVWNSDGGYHYFGYKAETGAEFKWFPAAGNSYTFRLEYGHYHFAVKESGSNNYSATQTEVAYADGKNYVDIYERWFDFTGVKKTDFKYTYNAETGTVVWYKLPDGLLPRRIQLVFGIGPAGTTEINWSETYSEDVNFYGIVVSNSDYDLTRMREQNEAFLLTEDVGITNVNGHMSSTIKGSSLYFMDPDASIHTWGNNIYLYTDMLVINGSIQGDGRVYVAPYNTEKTSTLAYFVKSVGPFTAKSYYLIPKNTNINGVSDLSVSGIKYCGTVGDDGILPSEVNGYFRSKVYPELNPDIAYANNAQLASIVSSETIGWTQNGVMSGSSETTNQGYVVCAYVSDIVGEVSYKANRVLIAAKEAPNKYEFNVPANLTFTTRYLSIDADKINQENPNVKFTLHNLAQDSTYLDQLLDIVDSVLGVKLSNFCSKTLQMDYERYTNIVLYGNEKPSASFKSQICRYEEELDENGNPIGVNLFEKAKNTQPLLVTYTTTELTNLFGSKIGGTVKTIDRYVKITCDSPDNNGYGLMNVGAWTKNNLYMYANYLYFDSTVDEIRFKYSQIASGLLGQSDLLINSQESGYTTNEYLGLFATHTAESKNGTLIYIEDQLIISKYNLLNWKIEDPITLKKGFYFIYAKDGSTTITKLADDPSLKVDIIDLRKYSVYVNPDGSLSNAYVDTGLFDNENEGTGGFSGGNTQ